MEARCLGKNLLFKRCQASLDPHDVTRGKHYAAADAVTIVTSGPEGCAANVWGSAETPYRVVLDWADAGSDGSLLTSCTCPRFFETGGCKHVVAAILELDRLGRYELVPGERPLRVDVGDPSSDFLDEDDNGDDFPPSAPRGSRGSAKPSTRPQAGAKRPPAEARKASWRQELRTLQFLSAARRNQVDPRNVSARSAIGEVWYVVLPTESNDLGELVISLHHRLRAASGEWGALKRRAIRESEIETLPDPLDREVLNILRSGRIVDDEFESPYFSEPKLTQISLPPALYDVALPRLAATQRLCVAHDETDPPPAVPRTWTGAPPLVFEVSLLPDHQARAWQVTARFYRDNAPTPEGPALLLGDAGLAIFATAITPYDARGGDAWTRLLLERGPITVPFAEQDKFIESLWKLPELPPLQLPAEFRWEQVQVAPIPRVAIRPSTTSKSQAKLEAQVSFDYGGHLVPLASNEARLVDRDTRQVFARDPKAEARRLQELYAAGFRDDHHRQLSADAVLPAKLLPQAATTLTAQGWYVEAEGARIRVAGALRMSVASGVDWFDLDAHVEYDGTRVALPKLLEALRHDQKYVRLDDGTRGLLPEEWLKKYSGLASVAEVHDGKLRFVPTQAMFLDALLDTQPEAQVDAQFSAARSRLRSFAGVQPRSEPGTFQGALRGYQREGLGWLHFLQEFGFGGCLADDMGLGKTVQVLALLEERRTRRLKPGQARSPSLVVVPRSLVHNWIEEASRFAPKLRVVDYTGLDRGERFDDLEGVHLVVTTYGTLRRDIIKLKDVRFDYAILDESQAMKNAASQAAKAARLIQADHRLAMTGTPVENHLRELWSLFEFLNPGMLGRSEVFKRLVSAGGNSTDGRELLARALRPFLLRRTKEQVLKELPEKTEQTLYCELEAKQRRLYNELRDHYRGALLARVAKDGLNRSKIHVLEALLRLRQAACHPGLLDEKQLDEPSAKLEALLEQLREVAAEGHKALVFSQFTSLLAIVRRRLEAEDLTYEYLDGRTRDRQQRVERFQNDAACRLFLISLKAGGVGLNLTAADYVFILDPWWNPAVEAQAVDRAHRIGQSRRVFAYRLIARDTVEEKILELQREKRELAEAIITADGGLISSLTASDLQALLS